MVKAVPRNVAEIIVVRHGETTWNASGTLQGQAQSKLNDKGRDQARAIAERLAAERFPVAAVYSSDLDRAVETAEIIANKCPTLKVALIPELRERNLGKLEGLSRKEARELEPEAYQVFCSKEAGARIPGGGESYNELFQRSKAALENIAQKHLGDRVIVVTHGGVLYALHHYAKGVPPAHRALNTSLNIFKINDQNCWSLNIWGDVTHLKGNSSARTDGAQDVA